VARRNDLASDRNRAINRLRAQLQEYFPALERAFDFAHRKGALILLTGYQTPDGLWNRPHHIDATALIDGQNGLQPGSSNESLNHPVNHYHIGAGTRINLGTFVAACRPRLGIRCRLLYYASLQSCCVGAFSITRGRDLRRRRVNQS
jgi:hypothetical protein